MLFWEEMLFFLKYSLQVEHADSQLNTHGGVKKLRVAGLVSCLISPGKPATTSHACFRALYRHFHFLP